jgi:hypothetical protein
MKSRKATSRPSLARKPGVGDREHQGRAVAREPAADLELELGDDREADREHHRGGRGIRDPERDEGGREEQAEQQAPGLGADRAHDGEGDAAVEVPLLHRGGDPHAAEKEEDVGIEVGEQGALRVRGEVLAVKIRERHDEQRQTGGPGHRHRFADPPERHQRRHRCGEGRPRAELADVAQRRVDEPDAEEEQEPEDDEARPDHPLVRPARSGSAGLCPTREWCRL